MSGQAVVHAQAIERSVVKKLMWGLVPFLALLYVFNILDRGNVSIAALTMQKDLHFSDGIYGFGAGIFFIGYFLLEVPSNLIMERVGARRWIARIMISWGAISASMMFVRTPFSFYSLRFLLGLRGGGVLPRHSSLHNLLGARIGSRARDRPLPGADRCDRRPRQSPRRSAAPIRPKAELYCSPWPDTTIR